MPLLGDLLAAVASLTAVPAMIGVFVTAMLLVVSRDWRLNLIVLAVQYFFVSLLMTQLIRLEVAAVKGLIGWLICLVFYLTEQQAKSLMRASDDRSNPSLRTWFAARVEGWRHQGISARSAFGFMAAILVTVTAYAVAFEVPLPQTPRGLTLICYVLMGLGVLLIGVTQDPLRTGFGMLTFLSGFDLFYVALEPSLVVTGLLGSISFVIALGMAYLKTSQATLDGEDSSV